MYNVSSPVILWNKKKGAVRKVLKTLMVLLRECAAETHYNRMCCTSSGESNCS